MRMATSSSPRPSTVLPGPVQNSSTGTMRSPLGPAITHSRAIDDERARRVGRRRRVAEVAADRAATLNLGRADQADGLDEPRPETLDLRMLADQLGGRVAAPRRMPRASIDDPTSSGMRLMSMNADRTLNAGAELNEQVGPAGDHARSGIGLHQANGLGNRYGGFVSNGLHGFRSVLSVL